MARFLKIYLTSLILIGVSACQSDDQKATSIDSFSSFQSSHKIQGYSKPNSTSLANGSSQTNSSFETKTLTAQSTDNASSSSLSWDIDKDGNADALTDGLLLLRYSFGLRGNALVEGAVSEESALSATEVASSLEATLDIADIDGDNQVDALTDGLLLLRYLFGLTGESLVNGAISEQASRSSAADISQYLMSHIPEPENNLSTITISGKVTFDLIPFETSGNGLDHDGTYASAARSIVVEALDSSGNVVASNNTDNDGNYSLETAKDIELRVRVSAKMIQINGPSWNIKVSDNTTIIGNENPLYVTDSSPFTTSQNIVKNIHLPAGRNGENSGVRSAAPFAILDTIYDSMQKIVAVEPDINFPPLVLYWSPNNNPSAGSLENGDLGSSFFLSPNKIYILGDENSDTDEYDRHVIAHEWIHYFEDNFSRSDSIGGSHGQQNRLDMRVAFSEGLANALSGVITSNPIYRDSDSFWPYFGWSMNMETTDTPNPGWFSENSVQAIIYDLYDASSDGADNTTLGFEPIYSALTSADYITNDYLISIFPFVKILKDQQPTEVDNAIDSLLISQQIFGSGHNGAGETNDGDISSALPVYKQILANNNPLEVCYNNSAGALNKLGNRSYILFDVASAGNYQIDLTPKGAASASVDADLSIRKSGTLLGNDYAPELDGNANLSIYLTPGKHIVETGVWDPEQSIPTDSYCFNLRISNN